MKKFLSFMMISAALWQLPALAAFSAGEVAGAPPVVAPPMVNILPVAPVVAPAQRGFGPAPLRPHFSGFNSNREVRLRTAPPPLPCVTPAWQREVVTLIDASMNGTAGAKHITILTGSFPVCPVPVEPAPVQPIIVAPCITWDR